jgi:hypothetical protein
MTDFRSIRMKSEHSQLNPNVADAVRIVHATCCLAGSASYLDDISADLGERGIGRVGRTGRSMRFSAKRCAYSDMPSFSSQSGLHIGTSRTSFRSRISAHGGQGGRGCEIHLSRSFPHAADKLANDGHDARAIEPQAH